MSSLLSWVRVCFFCLCWFPQRQAAARVGVARGACMGDPFFFVSVVWPLFCFIMGRVYLFCFIMGESPFVSSKSKKISIVASAPV
jgi:hypothetical protein